MLITIVHVAAKDDTTRYKRIRGRRRLALPLDIELDDDWDWTIRAPKDDPDIHNTAGKSGASGKYDTGKNNNNNKNAITVIDTQPPVANIDSPSKPNKGKNDNDMDNNKPSSKVIGDDSLEDESSYSTPTESPSARPSQSPHFTGTIILQNNNKPTLQTTNDPNEPSNVEESTVSHEAGSNENDDSGMLIGISVSSVGLVVVGLVVQRRRSTNKRRLIRTALEEDSSVHKRRKMMDGVVEEDGDDDDDDYIDNHTIPIGSSVTTFQQAPATPGPLSPRDGVVVEEEEKNDEGAFAGVYKLCEHYNLTAFLEATRVPWAIRSAAARARPMHFITHQGNVITMKFKGVPRATYVLNGPPVQNVLRDRTFACTATYTDNNLGFEVEQRGVDNGDYDMRLRWTLSEDDMTVHLTMTAIFVPDLIQGITREPVTCIQVFNRIGEF